MKQNVFLENGYLSDAVFSVLISPHIGQWFKSGGKCHGQSVVEIGTRFLEQREERQPEIVMTHQHVVCRQGQGKYRR